MQRMSHEQLNNLFTKFSNISRNILSEYILFHHRVENVMKHEPNGDLGKKIKANAKKKRGGMIIGPNTSYKEEKYLALFGKDDVYEFLQS
jgi:hypothetical protein